MKSVMYVATTNEINIKEYVDRSPRNWIPKGRCKPLMASKDSEKAIYRYNPNQESGNLVGNTNKKCKKSFNQLDTDEDSQSRCRQSNKENNLWNEENINSTQDDSEWNDINEVIESDFLISPGDIYPNRKVELQDAPATDKTKKNI